MKPVRIILWGLVAFAVGLLAVLLLRPPAQVGSQSSTATVNFGGPFTLTGADGQPFPSS